MKDTASTWRTHSDTGFDDLDFNVTVSYLDLDLQNIMDLDLDSDTDVADLNPDLNTENLMMRGALVLHMFSLCADVFRSLDLV